MKIKASLLFTALVLSISAFSQSPSASNSVIAETQTLMYNGVFWEADEGIDAPIPSQSATAIQLMDSIYLWHYDTAAQAWNTQPSGKEIEFTYDANYNKTHSVKQIWNGTGWENSLKFSATFDVNSNMTSRTTQYWDGSQWVNSRKWTYLYDANQNQTSWLRQLGDGISGWENQFQGIYEYDGNNNNTLWNRQNWNGTGWENQFQHVRTYDSNDNLLSELAQSGDSILWVNSTLNAYTYDGNDNLIDHVEQDWSGTEWADVWNYSYAYDGNDNEIEKISRYWNGTEWVNNSKWLQTYDTSNNLLIWMRQTWSETDGAWRNVSRNNRSYDQDNNNTELLSEIWNNTDSIWEYDTRSYWEYDGEGNVITSTETENWNGSEWAFAWNSSLHTFSYNQFNKEITSNGYQWSFIIEDWEQRSHTSHEYDADTLLLNEASIPGSPIYPDENGDSLYYYYHTINLAVSDIVDDSFVTLYPNPSNTGMFTILNNGNSTLNRYEIYNAVGQLRQSENLQIETGNRLEINCANYESGVYFLVLFGEKHSSSVRKIVIQ